MNTPAKLHKLTVFSQNLNELLVQTLAEQNRIIKSAGEEDLRYMLLNRYPLRLNEIPDTIAALIREVEGLLPDIKRIIELLKNKKLNYIHTTLLKYIHTPLDDQIPF